MTTMLMKSEVIDRLLRLGPGAAMVSSPDGPYAITDIFVHDDLIFLDTFSDGPSMPKEIVILYLSLFPELQVVIAPPMQEDGTRMGAHYVLDDEEPWLDDTWDEGAAVVLPCNASNEEDLHLNYWTPEGCLNMGASQINALKHAVRVRKLADPDYKL